ncbi:MAG TPA: phosphopyruvate hydratase [Solirubrobacteraceae bacterium]|jgi:enolase
MTEERIAQVSGREILDSRGRPTVEAAVVLHGGVTARASVPSGASTGRHEAVERRDGDPGRYGGAGVRDVADAIATEISPAVAGLAAGDQAGIDRALINLDGTPDKSRLGANATLAVSLAVARAAARARGVELWRHLGSSADPLLPLPMVNMISGGLHAGRGLDFQDFLIIPVAANSVDGAMETCVVVRDALQRRLADRGLSTLKADEGGFGPRLESHEEALALIVAAVEAAGLTPGEDVALALDVAASHFYDPHRAEYTLAAEGRRLDAAGMLDVLEDLVARYPIVSIEDPLAEDDWDGWRLATERLGRRVQLIGDDLFVTNPHRLRRGIGEGVANAVLVKMNQIGTLTETLEVVERARAAGYATVASARSGETEDDALADLAIGFRAGQIKVGSVAQSERLAKYNRLTLVERELGHRARFAGRDAIAAGAPAR